MDKFWDRVDVSSAQKNLESRTNCFTDFSDGECETFSFSERIHSVNKRPSFFASTTFELGSPSLGSLKTLILKIRLTRTIELIQQA